MGSVVETERKLTSFFAEFMSVQASPADQLEYLLTSIQQFELIMYVESEFGVTIDATAFEHATIADLARTIAAAPRS